jgi:alanine-synthesizing transaminase
VAVRHDELLSRRTNWHATPNRLALARAAHPDALDLTVSNPTTASLPYPLDELCEIFSRAARAPYNPQPLGLPSAREAVAREIGCHAADIVITASTSEAYSFLFKLLCNPGDSVVTPKPAYPLLEHLAALEMIELRHVPLEFHKRWELDASRIPIDDRTRAIVVVNPNNPTGSYVTPSEQEAIARFALPVISDEVFLDYPLEGRGTSFVRDDVLTFTLGGLSKYAGLPHYKLGWIRVSGPAEAKHEAIAGLELVADTFLSVSTPVQVALPELLAVAPRIRAGIGERLRGNLRAVQTIVAANRAAQLLPVEGGWSVIIRLPRFNTGEEFALAALEKTGVLIHPGYFFDFEAEGYFVISLLTDPETLRAGLSRLLSEG